MSIRQSDILKVLQGQSVLPLADVKVSRDVQIQLVCIWLTFWDAEASSHNFQKKIIIPESDVHRYLNFPPFGHFPPTIPETNTI